MKPHRLDLREKPNTGCQGCDRTDRKEVADDGLCTQTVSVLDGLPVRCVGEWAYDKIFRLVQYFGTFTTGMKNAWHGLNYVEICCGPGRCVTYNDRKEIDGTALAIITHPVFRHLRKALFIDANPKVVKVLGQRIAALGASEIAQVAIGNYEDAPGIQKLLAGLPDRCLNLVFIDPTDCGVPFTTIQAIVTRLKNADLIINVALRTDVTRNLVSAILSPAFSKTRQKYERFLGIPGFCKRADVIELAKRADHDDLRRLFLNEYLAKLNAEGYHFADLRPVKHYYYLLFTSRNEKGLEFWLKSCCIGPDNQREFFAL
jgi:three-Cys-motif partner protein